MAATILVLVVGPSGAGKDSVLEAALSRLPASAPVRRVRRDITRPADAGGEAHNAVSEAEFERHVANGAYGLSWRAHGLGYGAHKADLTGGQGLIVLNASRGAIDEARARYPEVRVLHVTAPMDVLAQRLADRGRESAQEVHARLSRQVQEVTGPDVVEIYNDGPLDQAADQMVQALTDWLNGV